MKPVTSLLRKAALGLLALAALAAPSAGQEPTKGELEEAHRRIQEHARKPVDDSHDPLRLSGREQGENDLRSRTPALARSVPTAERIDPEEAHRRALALYEDGARFRAAPSAHADTQRRAAKRKASVSRSEDDETAFQTMARPWWQVALPGFLVGALLVALLYRRLRLTGAVSG